MALHLSENIPGDFVTTVVFGLLAILLIVVGYIAFDKLTPKMDFSEQLNQGNVAVAIVVGAFILGVCLVVAKVVGGILG